MSSEYSELFVWIWLPGKTDPVVAGKLSAIGPTYVFNYGKSYLERDDAIAIYDAELPLRPGLLPLLPGLVIPGCLRDAAPDAWGRRVILNRKFGKSASAMDPAALNELCYLFESGSDRIGALDFQLSPARYEPRPPSGASLIELIDATDRVEKGIPLPPNSLKRFSTAPPSAARAPRFSSKAAPRNSLRNFPPLPTSIPSSRRNISP